MGRKVAFIATQERAARNLRPLVNGQPYLPRRNRRLARPTAMYSVDEALAERLNNRRHEQHDRAGEQQIAMALAVTHDQQRQAADEKCDPVCDSP